MIDFYRSFNFNKSKEQAKKSDGNKPIFLTGLKMSTYAGLIYDDRSKMSIFYVIFSRFWFIMGTLFFLSPALVAEEPLGLIEYVHVVHYTTFNFGCLIMSSAFVIKSREYISFCKLLEKEFKCSKEKLSESEDEIMTKTGRFLLKFVHRMCIVYYSASTCNFMKGPILEGTPLPYRAWVPLNVDNWPGYIVTYISEMIIPLNVVNCLNFSMISYVIHAKQLSAQFEILSIYIKETFEYSNYSSILNREEFIKRRIKRIIERHQLLVRCMNMFQDVYNWLLFSMTITSGVLICTNVFLVTAPNNDLAVLIEFVNLLSPEIMLIFLYCWFGQQMTDKWSEIRDAVYDINWFDESISTRKSLLNILTVSTKSKIVKGGGLQPFNMEGFAEILQASFSYFNMLKALR
ncbi:hypothetical protein O3M35_008169 [Rhynocoris fuscipes]|uniref:Odorant receptor n=1 Tax=Rhynocoris fuscipes TaxID=488301 RepID=A0AAW1D5E2_9HEMI